MALRGMARGLALALAMGAVGCGGSSSSTKDDDNTDTEAAAWKAAETKAEALLATMTQAEKLTLLKGQSKDSSDTHKSAGYIPAITLEDSSVEATIPALYLCDSPSGVGNSNTGVTRFSTGISVAATFDRSLARAFGDAAGYEWRNKGCNYALGPGVNLVRMPYGGRSGEYYGEDPYLAGQIGASEVKGIQGQNVIATVKHYAANNQETSRNGVNVRMSERTLRELYLPAFETILGDGGAGAVMCSYNRLNDGDYACQNPHLLGDVLRTDWGFKGVVMSDWYATHELLAPLSAGLDMEMPGTYYTPANLTAALSAGTVTQARLDAMALHVLTAMYKIGTFDHFPTTVQDVVTSGADADGNAVDHLALTQEISAAGTVLLKNVAAALPLDKTDSTLKVLVVGGAASDDVQSALGGSGSVNATGTIVSTLAGIQALVPGASQVTYVQGARGGSGYLSAPTTVNTTNFKLYPDASEATEGVTLTLADAAGDVLASSTVAGISYTSSFMLFDQYSYASYFSSLYSGASFSSGALEGWTADFSGVLDLTGADTKVYQLNLTGGSHAQLYVDGSLVGAIDTTCQEDTQSFDVTLTGAQHTLQVKLDTSDWVYWAGFMGSEGPMIKLSMDSATEGIAEAVAAAAEADVTVVVASDSESEGSDHPATLPGNQNSLIEQVAAVSPKTIVVLNTGSGVALPWADKVDAILENWYGGQETGAAVASILFGDVNPSGRTVVTFPASLGQWYAQDASQFPGVEEGADSYPTVNYDEGLLMGYRWFDQQQLAPLFPFGHGLSYTTFAYSDLKLSSGSGSGDRLTVKVTVTNTGSRSGAEVAQLYVGFPSYAGEPPRQLKGFEKLSLAAGASGTATFELDARAFQYWDEAGGAWVTPPGTFTIYVGSSSRDIRATGTYTVKG